MHTSAFVPGVGEGGLGEEEEANALARHLAERLDDPGSVCFFERVVAAVPRDLIHLALERAMAVPSHHIRRSRAAFFTTLVKPHLERAER